MMILVAIMCLYRAMEEWNVVNMNVTVMVMVFPILDLRHFKNTLRLLTLKLEETYSRNVLRKVFYERC